MTPNHQSPRLCPYCGGELAPGARKCRHCGEWVESNSDDIYYSLPDGPGPSGEQPGFFQTYFIDTFCNHYADFKGNVARKTFWLSLLAMAVITSAVAGTAGAVDVLMGSPGDGSLPLWITLVWALLFLCPFVALFTRRLRDAGYAPFWALALGVPVIGWLMMLLLGCMPSRSYPSNPPARFCGVDAVILVLCLLLTLSGTILDAFGAGFSYDTEDSFEGDTVYSFSDTTSIFRQEDEQAVTVAPDPAPAASSQADTTRRQPAASASPSADDGNPDPVPQTPADPEPDPDVW